MAKIPGLTVAPALQQQSFFSFGLLIKLRWIAILGQLLTIIIVDYYLHFSLPRNLCLGIISFSVLVNSILWLYHGNRKRIPLQEIPYFLLYDLGQLTALIFVTGGLNNPFVLLILVPVIVAAGFLAPQKSLIIAVTTLLAILVLSLSPYPLPWHKTGITLPPTLQLGVAIALITATIFLMLYLSQIAQNALNINQALQATQLALAREQRVASLGALAAAAAHELGTPLNTITLIAKDLTDDTSLPLAYQEDLKSILEQVYRCRDILQDLARNFAGDKRLPFSEIPLTAAINTLIQQSPESPSIVVTLLNDRPEPFIKLLPELVHSLQNILSNAQQFAYSKVEIKLDWTDEEIEIYIVDDGTGFKKEILAQLGNPYVSSRLYDDTDCHLGLGLFIAQTLLAQLGGQLYFYNQEGAACKVVLPRARVEALPDREHS